MARGRFRERLRRASGAAFFLACALYLGFHTVWGERGALAWAKTSERVAVLRAAVAETRAERMVLEHRVGLLRADSLDPDMLEERTAAVLNLAPPGTRVIFDGDTE